MGLIEIMGWGLQLEAPGSWVSGGLQGRPVGLVGPENSFVFFRATHTRIVRRISFALVKRRMYWLARALSTTRVISCA